MSTSGAMATAQLLRGRRQVLQDVEKGGAAPRDATANAHATASGATRELWSLRNCWWTSSVGFNSKHAAPTGQPTSYSVSIPSRHPYHSRSSFTTNITVTIMHHYQPSTTINHQYRPSSITIDQSPRVGASNSPIILNHVQSPDESCFPDFSLSHYLHIISTSFLTNQIISNSLCQLTNLPCNV